MTYRIELTSAAERDFRGIRDRSVLRRLSRLIEGLAHDPYPPQARKLQGAGDIWRVRAGDWRVCYTVDAGRLIVVILTAAPRRDVYERLRRRLG